MATYLYWCKIATIISKPSIVDAEEMNEIEWSVSLPKISFAYSLLGTRLAIISSTSRTSSRSSSWAFKCLIYVLFAIRYYLCPMLIPCTVDGSWTEESEFISIFKAIQINQSSPINLIWLKIGKPIIRPNIDEFDWNCWCFHSFDALSVNKHLLAVKANDSRLLASFATVTPLN